MKYAAITAAVILFAADGTAANVAQLVVLIGAAAYLFHQQTKEQKQ